MARAGRQCPSSAGPRACFGLRRRGEGNQRQGPQRRGRAVLSEIPKRLTACALGCSALVAVLILSDSPLAAEPSAEPIRAIRVWPAPDYTRVTVESGEPLRHRLILLRNPERLALDLDDVDFPSVQQGFAGKVSPSDPYIGNLRVGRFKPGVVRVVLDLKTEVKPQIFTLAPIGEYGHRLVLDIYPIEPLDPILALLQKRELKTEPGIFGTPDEQKPGARPSIKQPQPPAPADRLVT